MSRLYPSMIGSEVLRTRKAVTHYGTDGSYTIEHSYKMHGLKVVNITETHLYFQHTDFLKSERISVLLLTEGWGDDAWTVTKQAEMGDTRYSIGKSPSVGSLKNNVGKIVIRTKSCKGDYSYTSSPVIVIGYDGEYIYHKDAHSNSTWVSKLPAKDWDDGNWTLWNPTPTVNVEQTNAVRNLRESQERLKALETAYADVVVAGALIQTMIEQEKRNLVQAGMNMFASYGVKPIVVSAVKLDVMA